MMKFLQGESFHNSLILVPFPGPHPFKLHVGCQVQFLTMFNPVNVFVILNTYALKVVQNVCFVSVERARVLYAYKAENADELSIEEGQIINILDKVRLL